MYEGNGFRDQGLDAVAAIMRERGVDSYEVVDRAFVLDHPAGNEALLVRFPEAAPEILIVRVERRDRSTADHAEAVLREAVGHYAHASRSTSDLLKRYENERDRTAIERTLRALAAGEVTREQAVQALGLPSMVQLALLQHEFKIPGSPAMVDMSVDLMQDVIKSRAEDWKARSYGIVPTGDYGLISDLRKEGRDDGHIRERLGLHRDVVLPTEDEIARYTDSLVYGTEPGAPPAGLTVTDAVGTKNAKVRIAGTDGVESVKVANPRYVGRTLSGYVDEALDRMGREGSLPETRER